ncbi:MAG TPA: glycogen debranching enzyme N-terminal domain-containing protein, partial [Thermoanaerobaculia bacterium]|nr:glycogen debranching enzyme N-terminal domain-containing protein [Thermoanaerobaculia bacterium]
MIAPERFTPQLAVEAEPEPAPRPVLKGIPLAPLPDSLLTREWLVTNGLGGYASGTLSGIPTRRYHGLLVAALDPPRRRHVFLSHVDVTVTPARDLGPLSRP